MATRVERAGIEACISKVNQAIEELNAAAKQVNDSMNELPNYWEGAAYDKARSVYEEQYQGLLTNTVPKAVEDFRNGKTKALQALFGACMRELKGAGDPAVIKQLLESKLS